MGAFNTVALSDRCAVCETDIERLVQFKYGDTFQHRYRIGDQVRWGGNDIGYAGHKAVVLDGAGEHCPACGDDRERDYVVRLEADVIVGVISADGSYDFISAKTSFLVLEP